MSDKVIWRVLMQRKRHHAQVEKFCFPVKDLLSKSKLRINGRIQVSDIDKSLIDPFQQEQTLFT